MSQNQLNKIINFYNRGIYTKAMIDAMHDAGKITDEEYQLILDKQGD